MFQKTKSKKGFTLAELLIVVAIIAVLTAIAVPLFVTNISKAQDTTFKANQQVVREAAVVQILTADDGDANSANSLFVADHRVYAGAKITDDGTISNLEIKSVEAKSAATGLPAATFTDAKLKTLTKVTENYKEWHDTNGGYILVEITKLA